MLFTRHGVSLTRRVRNSHVSEKNAIYFRRDKIHTNTHLVTFAPTRVRSTAHREHADDGATWSPQQGMTPPVDELTLVTMNVVCRAFFIHIYHIIALEDDMVGTRADETEVTTVRQCIFPFLP